jgi:hypothetical protein
MRFGWSSRKRDSNQSKITKDLQDIGALVIDTSMVPGFVDAVVGFRGSWSLLEFKGEFKKLRGEKQKEFHAICKTMGLPVYLVKNTDDALRAIKAIV